MSSNAKLGISNFEEVDPSTNRCSDLTSEISCYLNPIKDITVTFTSQDLDKIIEEALQTVGIENVSKIRIIIFGCSCTKLNNEVKDSGISYSIITSSFLIYCFFVLIYSSLLPFKH